MKKFLIITFAMLLTACSQRITPPGLNEVNQLSENGVHGRKIFMDKCHRCHPNGMAGLGPSIFNKPLPGFLIRFQVRKGLGTMPSFGKENLTKEDLDKLITYIKEN